MRSIFGWAQVVEDRNLEGPYSFGVPGQVAGAWLAHRKFGRLPWARLVTPAAECAEVGLAVDWYTTLKIAAAARSLARYESSAKLYLPDGAVPTGDWLGSTQRLRSAHLASTLRRIAEAGGDDFYRGDLASAIAADAMTVGSSLSLADLQSCHPSFEEVGGVRYRDATIFLVPGLTAGPSLVRALGRFSELVPPARLEEVRSDGALFPAMAEALFHSYAHRLVVMGDSQGASKPTCTTHISVIGRNGDAVSWTQTLLDIFGSRLTLPQTGILMNNAMMWFDPTPGKTNSIAPGRTPLSNMCPAVARVDDDTTIALGASGGRRIFPAVMQLLIFLIDRGMSLDEAIHYPRIDVSGNPWVIADTRLAPEALGALQRAHEVRVHQNGVFPNYFACPNVVMRNGRSGVNAGGAFVTSPWASAAAG